MEDWQQVLSSNRGSQEDCSISPPLTLETLTAALLTLSSLLEVQAAEASYTPTEIASSTFPDRQYDPNNCYTTVAMILGVDLPPDEVLLAGADKTLPPTTGMVAVFKYPSGLQHFAVVESVYADDSFSIFECNMPFYYGKEMCGFRVIDIDYAPLDGFYVI